MEKPPIYRSRVDYRNIMCNNCKSSYYCLYPQTTNASICTSSLRPDSLVPLLFCCARDICFRFYLHFPLRHVVFRISILILHNLTGGSTRLTPSDIYKIDYNVKRLYPTAILYQSLTVCSGIDIIYYSQGVLFPVADMTQCTGSKIQQVMCAARSAKDP